MDVNFRKNFVVATVCTILAVNSLDAYGGERVKILNTPGGGEVPDAEIDDSGAIHVVYVKGENAFYAKSVDGESFAEPLRINSELNTVHPANMFRGPDVAVGKDGRVHVIWYVNAYQRKRPQDDWGVFYSYLEPGKDKFQPAKNLNRKPSDNYSLAADNRGNVAVVWMAGELFLTSSADNGESFTTEKVSVADPCECCASRALFDRNGALLMLYRDKAENARNMHLIVREKNSRKFENQKLSSTNWEINACPMTGAFLGASGSKTTAAWETKGSAFFARLNGEFPPNEIKLATRGKWPVAFVAADGAVLASWKQGTTVFWQLFDKNDNPLQEAQSMPSENSHRHAGVVRPDGTFIVIH